MKRRHQLAIVVPNPDEPLPPPGIAYSQPGPSKLQSRDYPIRHKGSQSSARTSNSIGIEVVPPVSWSFVLILIFFSNILYLFSLVLPLIQSNLLHIPDETISALIMSSVRHLSRQVRVSLQCHLLSLSKPLVINRHQRYPLNHDLVHAQAPDMQITEDQVPLGLVLQLHGHSLL